MKFTQKIKKFVAITFAGAIVLLTSNSLPAHAQDISQVSVYKPGYGMAYTESGSGVNVRNAPNLDKSDIIRSIPSNTCVMIVGVSGNFYKVQYDAYGHYGYMSKDYVFLCPTDYYFQADTVNGGSLNMYEYTFDDPKYAITIATIPNKTYFAYYLDYIIDSKLWYIGIYGTTHGYTQMADTKLCFY